MKYACNDPIYDLFQSREDAGDKLGQAVGSYAATVETTADAAAACLAVFGSGDWKRRLKKTLGGKNDNKTYRVMEDKTTGKVVTIINTEKQSYDEKDSALIFEVDLRDHLDTIQAIMDYTIKHYIEVDGGAVLYNCQTNQVFLEFSDSFCIYVDDTADLEKTHEALRNWEEEGSDEGNWDEDPNNWIETHVEAVKESFYGDEWRPEDMHGFFLIGRFKCEGDFKYHLEDENDPDSGTLEDMVNHMCKGDRSKIPTHLREMFKDIKLKDEIPGSGDDGTDNSFTEDELIAELEKDPGFKQIMLPPQPKEVDITAEREELMALWKEFVDCAEHKGPEKACEFLGYNLENEKAKSDKSKRLMHLCDTIGKSIVQDMYTYSSYGEQRTPVPVAFSKG